MTDVSKIADSTAFKVVVPVLQTLICAAALGAFTYVNGTLTSLQTTLNLYQTNQALALQRLDSLERQRDINVKNIDVLRLNDQKQDFQLDSLRDSLKNLVLNGRPK